MVQWLAHQDPAEFKERVVAERERCRFEVKA
jgi:hypothetical protein